VSTNSSFDSAWSHLDVRFQACFGQAWESLRNRGLPVGAVVSFESEIISAGRNRVYDPAGGNDPLQRTPIAHAEMNAIAAALDAADLGECELWTTHTPCPMCSAAIDFTEIVAVHYLASDPSSKEPAEHFASSGRSDDVWIVAANALFLHNIAWVGGPDNPMLGRNQRHEAEVVALALDLVAQRTLIKPAEVGAGVEDALLNAWEQVTAAAMRRLNRQAGGS
jgi:tRNA(Arg) A34 adenosine deaminase TadA